MWGGESKNGERFVVRMERFGDECTTVIIMRLRENEAPTTTNTLSSPTSLL